MGDTANLDRSAIGHVYVNPGTGEIDLGAIRTLTIRADGKEVPHYDRSDNDFGIDLILYGSKMVEVDVEWEEIADIDLWKLVLHGTAGITTTSAGTQAVTDEALVMNGLAASGEWNALAYHADFDEDCAFNIQDAAGGGGTPSVEGTDYYLDRRTGHVGRISGGNISDGQTVYVDYVYKTYDGKYFEILSDTVPDEYAIRILKPLTNVDNLRIQHTKCTFSTTQELSLNPGDEGEWAGATSTIKFLKHDSTYGKFGRWEIYTP